jgi:hypothetical protein
MQSATRGHASAPRRILGLLRLALAALPAGCAGQPLPHPKGHEPPPLVDATGPAFVTPAHWDYHPPSPDTATASLRLGEAGCVFTAEGGQRWLSTPPKAASEASPTGDCSGNAEVAAGLAPEELTSIIRRSDKSWLFVGESGTLYEAPEPLAAFSRVTASPEPFAKVAGAGPNVLATTFEGKLFRWNEASGWQPLPSLPPGARLFDVAVAEEGRALALAFPEALFSSADGGATWTPARAPSIGARRVGVTKDGDLAAQGLLQSLEWSRKTGAFAPSTRALPSTAGATLDLTVAHGPSAAAVTAGRAAIDGDRYFEVLRPDNEGEDWTLARGKIEGRLSVVPIPHSGSCGSLRLGAKGKQLVTVCVSLEGSDITAAVRRSKDGGDSFSEPLVLSTPDTDQVNITLSPEGHALITGVCKPTPEGSSGCRPTAPILVRPDGEKMKAMGTGAPQLAGLALLPAFSFDGRSAYFLGRRGKDDRLTLFVSHDGGETFSPRSLDSPTSKSTRKPPDDDDEGSDSEPVEDTLEVDDSSSLRVGEDGTVGMLVLRYRGYTYMTTDEDGRVLSTATPPFEEAMMGGFGRRLVAFEYGSERVGEKGLTFWESVDGGATWEEQSAPVALMRELNRGIPGIVCSLGGCLLGETVSRVGWGGQGDHATTRSADDSALTSTPAVLTPIVCELSPTTKWARVEHPTLGPNGTVRLPDVNEAMRGRSVWSVLTTEKSSGAISAVSATLPESGEGEARLVTHKLLGSRPAGVHAATAVSRQMEGYAAARVTFPTDKAGEIKPSTPMRNIDVAWTNYLEGTTGHARIADAGVLERSDVIRRGAEEILDTGLITVTVRGIVVRPHSQRSRFPVAFFLDAAGKSERLMLPSWPIQGLGGYLDVRGDAVAVDGELFGVGMVRDGTGDAVALLLARRSPAPSGKPAKVPSPSAPLAAAPADRWDFTAFGMAPSRSGESPIVTHSDWTYAGKSAIGVTSLIAERRRSRGFAYFHGFRADGTFASPVPLPTLLDLGDRPRPCSAADRAAAPRFESLLFVKGEALFPGMRHPVLVSEPPSKTAVGISAPLALLTAAAVAYGTPASPCVAGWEANGVGQRNLGAVLSGDLARSWLFRGVPLDPNRASGPERRPDPTAAMVLEYRPMACHFDPSARIPESIWSEPGTARIER